MITLVISVSPDKADDLRQAAAESLRLDPRDIRFLSVIRKSIDARRHQVRIAYTLRLDVGNREKRVLARHLAEPYLEEAVPDVTFGDFPLVHRPVVIGAGPAGLLAAYRLAKEGYRPLLLEQGKSVDGRIRDTQTFFATGKLDPDSNVQFGEGGAGAFSDGKLNTRIRDPRCAQVLSLWAELLGAPEIASDARPHVGTDRLAVLLPRIRQTILDLGGEFRFGAKVDSILCRDGAVYAVRLSTGEEIPAEAVLLAPGHSARGLQSQLIASGLILEPRPFAMGVRCEQDQHWLDRLQYGKYAGNPHLGAASYSVSMKTGDTFVHSFCVCPGGQVVNASSEPGHLCVNGMSNAARDGGVINGALVVTVTPPQGAHPLWGVELQRKLEKSAFDAGGGQFLAPAQNMEDFLSRKPSTRFSGITPTVRPGAVPCDLRRVLPESITDPLTAALADFERKMPGFTAAGGVLTAVEARTSSPVRIPRNSDTGMNPQWAGLYPCGEGAGYAGGILSSAVDGFAQAERMMARFARPKGDTHVE